MSAGSPGYTFLDSNILVYADDASSQAKQRRAMDLIREHLLNRTGTVSLQVLQEYFVAATRKCHLDPGLARNKVQIYGTFRLVEPVLDDVLTAIQVHRLHTISYWDALILHTAKKSGCGVVLSEDMNHGQVIDGVRIVNPFL